MKKLCFLMIVVLSSSFAFSQNVIEFENKEDYDNHVFGELDYSYLKTDHLLEKAIESYDSAWTKYQYIDTDPSKEVFHYLDWFTYYQNITESQIKGNPIKSLEEITHPLFDLNLRAEPWIDGQKIPILIGNFQVDKIKESSFSTGEIEYNGGRFFDVSSSVNSFESVNLVCMTPFSDSLYYDNVVLEFKSDYYHTNISEDEIEEIKVDIGNQSFTIGLDQSLDISNLIGNGNEVLIEIEITYESGKIVESKFNIPKSTKSYIPNDGEDFFDDISIGYNLVGDWKYGVKYGCGNDGIRKPVILVSGYGAYSKWELFVNNTQGWPRGLMELYSKYNIEGFCEQLLATGHDIVIVRFVAPNGDVEVQADQLEGIISEINQQKMDNSSYHETTVIGFSGGAIASRLALDGLEYKYLNEGGPHPHTKLYVSFEGEHQGMNIPLSSQHAIKRLYEQQGGWFGALSPGGAKLNTLNYLLEAPMTKQLTTYYYTETGKIGVWPEQGQGHHPERTALLNKFDSYNHPKQIEKYGYGGYPAFSRIVSVSDGANRYHGSNSPFDFSAGDVYYEHEAPFSTYKMWFLDNQRITDPNPALNLSKPVFRFVKLNIFGGFQWAEEFRTNNQVYVLDNCPGGYLHGSEDAISQFVDKVMKQKLQNQPIINDYVSSSNTWVVSTHDIRNYDPNSDGYQSRYNLQSNGLMFNTFNYNFSLPSNTYGFPSLHLGGSQFSATPFEGIYCDGFNKTHILSQYYVAGNPNNSQRSEIKNYLMIQEIEPWYMYLQNRRIGWNALPSDTYVAHFEAKEAVFVGRKVTPKTQQSAFIVESNGEVEIKSEGAIHLQTGTIVEPGGKMHCYIGPIDYNDDCVIPPTDKNPIQISNQENRYENTTRDNEFGFSIYPNPASESFQIKLNNSEEKVFKVLIFDIGGTKCFERTNPESGVIKTNLSPGTYVVIVSANSGNVYRNKLVVQ